MSGQQPAQPPSGQPQPIPPGHPGARGPNPPPPLPPLPPAGTYPYQGPPQRPVPQPMSVSDERLWAMLSYILSIVVGLWAPLVIFLVFKDRSTFVRENSRESLNMHITVLIAVFGSSIILGFGGLVMFAIFFPLGIFAFILWAVIAVGASIAQLIFNILAGMKANDGYVYRIPCILRLVK